MQVDGFEVEKWRAQFQGSIDIPEEEGKLMPLDRLVVMVVATRVVGWVPKALDEEGTVEITRKNRIEFLTVMEGDMREKCLQMLATGSDAGLQMSLEVHRTADPETGEIRTDLVAERPVSYADPPAADDHADTLIGHALVESWKSMSDEPVTPGEPTTTAAEDEYFDVPVVPDDSHITGTVTVGHARDYAAGQAGGNGSAGGDGPRVGKVDFDQLATIGTDTPARSGPSGGEVVGSVYPPGHRGDKVLRDFFEEDIPHE